VWCRTQGASEPRIDPLLPCITENDDNRIVLDRWVDCRAGPISPLHKKASRVFTYRTSSRCWREATTP